MAFGDQVEVSVGAVTDTGPRSVNADRFFTSRSPVDGSWVIAVADGVGGHPQAPDAAAAAVQGLPERIDSLDAMRDAFVAAATRVAALAPSWDDFMDDERAEFGNDEVFDVLSNKLWMIESLSHRHTASCPLCTLCVAAWTPTGGLLVASMGDTLAFEVRWPAAGAPWRRLVAEPHRQPPLAHGVTSYLGAHPQESLICLPPGDYDDHRDGYNPYFAAVQIDLPSDPATAVAVIVASDGAWEPLWQIINAADYAAADPEARRTWYDEPVVLPDGWNAAPIDADEDPLPPAVRPPQRRGSWPPRPRRPDRSPVPPRRRPRSPRAFSTRPASSASRTTPLSPPPCCPHPPNPARLGFGG